MFSFKGEGGRSVKNAYVKPMMLQDETVRGILPAIIGAGMAVGSAIGAAASSSAALGGLVAGTAAGLAAGGAAALANQAGRDFTRMECLSALDAVGVCL
jgi:hypothetical protein